MTVTENMTIYACFYQRIKTVRLSLETPEAGLTVTANDEGQTPSPVVILEQGNHCSLSGAPEWLTLHEGIYSLFTGDFIAGETYYAGFLLDADFGYMLDGDTVIEADGATVVESSGRLTLNIILSVQATDQTLLGDADGDKEVTIIDATAIQRSLAGIPGEINETAADVDGDGEITIFDVSAIQRYLVGMACPAGIGHPIAAA